MGAMILCDTCAYFKHHCCNVHRGDPDLVACCDFTPVETPAAWAARVGKKARLKKRVRVGPWEMDREVAEMLAKTPFIPKGPLEEAIYGGLAGGGKTGM